MPIVELPDHYLSKAAIRRGTKHWIKELTGVDTSKKDGFAFEGTFQSFNATVEVHDGAMFLVYVEDRNGVGRLDGRTVDLLQVVDGKLETVQTWTLDGHAGWALKIRDEVEMLFTSQQKAGTATAPDVAAAVEFARTAGATARAISGRLDQIRDQLGGFSMQIDADLAEIVKQLDSLAAQGLGEG